MAEKFPTGISFQRLSDFPLDGASLFNTLNQAENYVSSEVSYNGQLIHIKDARTEEEKENNTNIYEEDYYVDYYHQLRPICSFTYKAIGLFLNFLYELLNGNIDDAEDILEELKELIYNNYTHDFNDTSTPGNYKTEPWNPANYTNKQIVLKMVTPSATNTYIGRSGVDGDDTAYFGDWNTDDDFEIEDVIVKQDGINTLYKIITFETLPMRLSFFGGTYIEKVIHMCDLSELRYASRLFFRCSSLTSINDISTWNTSKVESMDYMFAGCSKLTELNVSNFNTKQCKDYTCMFQGCKLLESLDVSSFETYNAQSFSGIFAGCTNLQTIDITSFYKARAQVQGMFSGCRNLTKIIGLDKLNTSAATDLTTMFHDCQKLRKIDVSTFDTTNAKRYANMFEHCYLITSLDLSHFNLSIADSVNGMFKDCIALKSLNLSNWKKTVDSRGWYERLFENCLSLEFENIITTNTNEDILKIITNEYNDR